MTGDHSFIGPMMRHGGGLGYPGSAHEAGTSSIEWAILGLAIAILAIVTLLLLDAFLRRRHMRRFRAGRSGHDKSLEILRLRYARGEIAHDEYSQTLADLGTTQGSATTPVERAETTAEEAQPKHRRGRK